MKRWGGVIILLSTLLWASPADLWHLSLTQYYSKKQQYSQAAMHYEKVQHREDAVIYNLGNIYYREKRYREAMAQYIQIEVPALMHQKYHNIGNCLMALGERASAVTFYRNALKFAKHPDTLFNLKLAQKLLRQQEKEMQERLQRESNEAVAFRDGSNKIDRFKENNGTDDLIDAKIPETIEKTRNISDAAYRGESGKIDTTAPKEQHSTVKKQNRNTAEGYEAQHWENFFRNRSLKTLLIPLETKGESHDKNPY